MEVYNFLSAVGRRHIDLSLVVELGNKLSYFIFFMLIPEVIIKGKYDFRTFYSRYKSFYVTEYL